MVARGGEDTEKEDRERGGGGRLFKPAWCSSGLREPIACAVVNAGPFACGRHTNCVFANTHHSARRAPVRRRGSHTPPRRLGGLLLFQRPSRAAGEPNQSPAQACREGELEFETRRDSGTGRIPCPSLSFSPQQEKRGLWKALPPDADVLADVCKSQQRVRMHVCMHAFFLFRCTDCVCAGNVSNMHFWNTPTSFFCAFSHCLQFEFTKRLWIQYYSEMPANAVNSAMCPK